VLSLCVCAEWKGWTLTRCLSVSQLFEAFLNNDVLFGKIPRGPILDSICNHLPYPSIHPSIYLYMCISVYNLWIYIYIHLRIASDGGLYQNIPPVSLTSAEVPAMKSTIEPQCLSELCQGN
jgi:hypothetical protein